MTDIGPADRAEVVSLKGYRQAMSYDPIAEIEAYWEKLRGVRVVPLRSEIDPRGFERALDTTFLIERIAPGLARFRLAGMKLTEIMGMEVRGMPLTSLLTPGARDGMRDALNMLFEGPNGVTISLQSERAIGRPKMQGRMVLLPLKSDLGDISRAIGCLFVDGKVGLTPRRFDVLSTTYRAIGPFKTEQPDAQPSPEPVGGFAESVATFSAKPDRDPPALRVITNEAFADEIEET